MRKLSLDHCCQAMDQHQKMMAPSMECADHQGSAKQQPSVKRAREATFQPDEPHMCPGQLKAMHTQFSETQQIEKQHLDQYQAAKAVAGQQASRPCWKREHFNAEDDECHQAPDMAMQTPSSPRRRFRSARLRQPVMAAMLTDSQGQVASLESMPPDFNTDQPGIDTVGADLQHPLPASAPSIPMTSASLGGSAPTAMNITIGTEHATISMDEDLVHGSNMERLFEAVEAESEHNYLQHWRLTTDRPFFTVGPRCSKQVYATLTSTHIPWAANFQKSRRALSKTATRRRHAKQCADSPRNVDKCTIQQDTSAEMDIDMPTANISETTCTSRCSIAESVVSARAEPRSTVGPDKRRRLSCQTYMPTAGGSLPTMPSAHQSHTQTASLQDLPDLAIMNIINSLEGNDILRIMATSRTMAKHVMTSLKVAKRPLVSIEIGQDTKREGFQQVMAWADHVQLAFKAPYTPVTRDFGQPNDIAVQQRMKRSFKGIRKIIVRNYMRSGGLVDLLDYFPGLESLELHFAVDEGMLQCVLHRPNIKHLRIGGLKSIIHDLRATPCHLESLHIHSEYLEYQALGFMPLSTLKQPINWTSPTNMQCVGVPDAYSIWGAAQVTDQARENLQQLGTHPIKAGPALHFLGPIANLYDPRPIPNAPEYAVRAAMGSFPDHKTVKLYNLHKSGDFKAVVFANHAQPGPTPDSSPPPRVNNLAQYCDIDTTLWSSSEVTQQEDQAHVV